MLKKDFLLTKDCEITVESTISEINSVYISELINASDFICLMIVLKYSVIIDSSEILCFVYMQKEHTFLQKGI